MKGKHIRAWHFCKGNKLRDGQKLVVGKTYSVEGPLVMCEHGLHWSRKIMDALRYAPGSTICLVEAWGDVEEEDDKGVSRYRKVIAKIEGEKLLRLFACDVAEQALTAAKVTDERSWNAINISRLYANGKATKEDLAAARAAGVAATGAATDAMIWAATDAMIWAATGAAARAAGETAGRPIGPCSWAEDYEAARGKQNTILTSLVLKAMKCRR